MLPDFVLGLLEESAASQVANHLGAGCDACRRALEEFQSASHLLAYELDPVTPPPEIKDRLTARLRPKDSVAPRRPLSPAVFSEQDVPSSPSWIASAWPFVAATLGGALLGFCYRLPAAVDEEQVQREAVAQYQLRIDQRRLEVGASDVQLASMRSVGPAPQGPHGVQGQFIWDATAQQIHVYVRGLTHPPGDRAYRVWFEAADGRWTPSALLQQSVEPHWTAVCDVPPPTTRGNSALRRLAVVESPAVAATAGAPGSAAPMDGDSGAAPDGELRLVGEFP